MGSNYEGFTPGLCCKNFPMDSERQFLNLLLGCCSLRLLALLLWLALGFRIAIVLEVLWGRMVCTPAHAVHWAKVIPFSTQVCVKMQLPYEGHERMVRKKKEIYLKRNEQIQKKL